MVKLVQRKPLLIGQAPSRITDSTPKRAAFSGASGLRLAIFIGISRERLLSIVEAINLNERFSGRHEDRGDVFDMEQARERAAQLSVEGRIVILAGRLVASAFDLGEMGYFTEREFRGARFVLIPHPSGANAFWNDVTNRLRARRFLRKLLSIEGE